ncbi:dihydrofolate reductase [Comamonas composti]|uniref:dihydrofolate reductase n=1 Tax=Comamonas composti TaxID=408558 RepID=UPI000402D9BE|nr:dihydrofolate reductase [Comamonas composti]
MAIHLIYARAANGVIGKNNTMPWHLPEDLAHFKQLTQGCAVVMGRKTWDSLPERFRPLPGRTNIVVTRQADWQPDPRPDNGGATRVLVASGLEQAFALGRQASETVWVMGGAQIYAQALPLATRIELTEIERDYEGDAFAPQPGPEWQETARSRHVSGNGLGFSFVRLERSA